MVVVKLGNVILKLNNYIKLLILAIVNEIRSRMWEWGGSYLACYSLIDTIPLSVHFLYRFH